MAPSRTIARLRLNTGGTTVITGEQSGRRYAFTWKTREQDIDPRDFEQFRTKTVKRSSCGCAGGSGVYDQTVYVFEVWKDP